MPKLKYEFKTFNYEDYEDYLRHATEMVKEGWKFSSQSNDHKEVMWVKYPDEKRNVT